MRTNRTYLLVSLFLAFAWVRGQEMAYQGDPDRSFFVARDLAFAGQRAIARDSLNRILTKYPNYSDVRNLLASTHSWDGNYEIARTHFNRITSADRKNKEAWVAAIKNELYAGEYYLALGLSNKALLFLKDDPILLELQKKALRDLEKSQEKPETELPALVDSAQKKDSMETQVLKNRFGMGMSFEIFDKIYGPMIYSHLEYRRETQAGPIIPRINYSNRFETHGVQYEIDFYPKFSKTFYGYLNYGISKSPIYPKHRAGAELYANWPKSMELSVGMRHLGFDETSANIITGSVGLYTGNYYFSLRPYITPGSSEQMGVSGNLLARRYFRDGENYLGVNAGIGYSPELKQLRDGDQLLAESLLYIESQQLLIEYQFTSKKHPNIYKGNFGVTRQELVFDSGNFFWAVSAGLTCQVKF